jgi:hypothetical protein
MGASRVWKESPSLMPREREEAALQKVTAWLDLPLSERIKRKDAYRQTLERCAECGGRLTYSRRKAPADLAAMKVA